MERMNIHCFDSNKRSPATVNGWSLRVAMDYMHAHTLICSRNDFNS